MESNPFARGALRTTIAGILLLTAACTSPAIELKARETVLRESLQTIRKMINQYAADQHTLPLSLDDLVRTSYMREVPIDPITGKADWDLNIGERSIGVTISRGIIDVHSHASGKSSDGVPYRDH